VAREATSVEHRTAVGTNFRPLWTLAVLTSRANVRQPMDYVTMGAPLVS